MIAVIIVCLRVSCEWHRVASAVSGSADKFIALKWSVGTSSLHSDFAQHDTHLWNQRRLFVSYWIANRSMQERVWVLPSIDRRQTQCSQSYLECSDGLSHKTSLRRGSFQLPWKQYARCDRRCCLQTRQPFIKHELERCRNYNQKWESV